MLLCIQFVNVPYQITIAFLYCFQVQDKFRLDLTDEEAVHYMQNMIDLSVSATMAALMEQMHKIAQVEYYHHCVSHCRVINPFALRVPQESIVCYFHTFENNLEIKQILTKYLKESCW